MKKRGRIEQLWAYEKYRVMYHSQKHYEQIRAALKGEPSYDAVAHLIESAKAVPPTRGSMVNAFDHMWGYFKNRCDEAEKVQYGKLKHDFLSGDTPDSAVIAFLHDLSEKYNVEYLCQSSLLEL
ncbi:DUF1722 domain-containing protein [Salinicoccus cyprini]|uniref:DUF1722 domain-containing protein n=1 Tax=Salinicoccus cyprini TaxID=2493691 RepID=A0A558AWS0_9STAP|nr:YbgA family protein [Salinicoccus cyprini]TVT28703.1 DUF1722 domain-containing protein [Salinicoccus cyprini]